STGTDPRDGQSAGTLQKDPSAGAGLPGSPPGGAGRNHIGSGRYRRSAARETGRALLPWLLWTLLLSAVVHLLRRVPAGCAVAAVEHRRVSGKCRRAAAHRGTDSFRMVSGAHRGAGRFRILPRGADGLV